MQPSTSTDIYTVTRLNRQARLILEGELGTVALTGEISNLATPSSGHWYFSLKDAQSQLRCAMFRGNNRSVAFRPKNGDQVLITGKITLYEPRGDYQLVAQTLAPAGAGLLKQQYETLKLRLDEEGLFAHSRKRPLPEHPKRVGIISSASGAALHDMLSVLARRAPYIEVVLYPSQVQGELAASQLISALQTANRRNETDLLILARGGGSLEDLWCFNDERLVRAIAASTLPVVSAVGHEVDITLSDLVADLRAPTPSAAAELISRDGSAQQQQYQQWQARLYHAQQRAMLTIRQRLTSLDARLQRLHPQQQLQQQAQQLDRLETRLRRAQQLALSQSQQQLNTLALRLQYQHPAQYVSRQKRALSHLAERLQILSKQQLNQYAHQLALASSRLNAISPLATLARGYSITQHNNKVLTDVSQLAPGDQLHTQLAHGEVVSQVLKLTP